MSRLDRHSAVLPVFVLPPDDEIGNRLDLWRTAYDSLAAGVEARGALPKKPKNCSRLLVVIDASTSRTAGRQALPCLETLLAIAVARNWDVPVTLRFCAGKNVLVAIEHDTAPVSLTACDNALAAARGEALALLERGDGMFARDGAAVLMSGLSGRDTYLRSLLDVAGKLDRAEAATIVLLDAGSPPLEGLDAGSPLTVMKGVDGIENKLEAFTFLEMLIEGEDAARRTRKLSWGADPEQSTAAPCRHDAPAAEAAEVDFNTLLATSCGSLNIDQLRLLAPPGGALAGGNLERLLAIPSGELSLNQIRAVIVLLENMGPDAAPETRNIAELVAGIILSQLGR